MSARGHIISLDVRILPKHLCSWDQKQLFCFVKNAFILRIAQIPNCRSSLFLCRETETRGRSFKHIQVCWIPSRYDQSQLICLISLQVVKKLLSDVSLALYKITKNKHYSKRLPHSKGPTLQACNMSANTVCHVGKKLPKLGQANRCKHFGVILKNTWLAFMCNRPGTSSTAFIVLYIYCSLICVGYELCELRLLCNKDKLLF